jgi:hypothetical protein
MKELQLEGPSNSGTIIIVSTIITNFRCLRKHSNCQFLQIELNNRLLYILHQSIKVSLIAVSLEQLIYLFLTRYCLLPIPPRTPVQRHPFPLGRQNYLNKDGWGSKGPGRTHSTYLIGGSQTVQLCQDSRTCCVQFWQTHPIPTRLSVSVASSIRLTMTIRSRHTQTTLNHRYSHSLTNETCSSTVSR